jgi:hypothetical protein
VTFVEIELRGFTEAEKALEGFAATMVDLRPFWPLVVPITIAFFGEQFATEGAAGGAPWAPLAPSTIAEKARHGGGTSILVDTGQMRRAASRPSRIATPSSLTLTIEDRAIGFAQDGTDRAPARPVIPDEMPISFEAELEAVADLYVADMARRFGL